MLCFSCLFSLWSSAPSLLLVGLVGRQLGLGVGLQYVQALVCARWGTPSNRGLFQDGDVVIGGLFSLHTNLPDVDHDFTRLPHYKPCSGWKLCTFKCSGFTESNTVLMIFSLPFSCCLSLEHVPLKYLYAMGFAVAEINNSTKILPGVKLGYHMFDSCGRPPWALQTALSLVGGDSSSCISADMLHYSGLLHNWNWWNDNFKKSKTMLMKESL